MKKSVLRRWRLHWVCQDHSKHGLVLLRMKWIILCHGPSSLFQLDCLTSLVISVVMLLCSTKRQMLCYSCNFNPEQVAFPIATSAKLLICLTAHVTLNRASENSAFANFLPIGSVLCRCRGLLQLLSMDIIESNHTLL